MARARLVHPNFFTDEAIVVLSPEHRLLFLGLLTEADRLGRTLDRPVRLKLRLMPVDHVDVNQILTDLHDAGLIVRYSVDGKAYLAIPNFLTYQRPHPREAQSVIPPPPFEGKPQNGDKASLGPTLVVQLQSGSSGSSGSSVPSGPSGDRGAVPPARSRAPIIGRNTHLDHVVCDDALSYCVPSAVHHKLADLLAPKHGGDREAAKGALLAWYPVVWAKLAPEFVMGDAFKFWQGQFDAMYATPRATAADHPQAVARPRNCKHDPPCVDDLAHTDRYRAELNQKKADGQKASA